MVSLPRCEKEFPTEREKLTPEKRKAEATSRRWEAEQGQTEYWLSQKAFLKNLERLRAERRAREALVKE